MKRLLSVLLIVVVFLLYICLFTAGTPAYTEKKPQTYFGSMTTDAGGKTTEREKEKQNERSYQGHEDAERGMRMFKPRYIKAEETEERIVALWRKEHGAYADTFNTAIDACQTIVLDMYDNSSPNVVEVVRCADCKWFQCNMRQDGYLPHGVSEYECRHWCGPCDPTDYCSYGEPLKEETE